MYNLQSKSFISALTLYVRPKNGSLVAIKIYVQLGYCTGIIGIRFVYNTGIETLWNSEYSAACLMFFLQKSEYLIKVRIYKTSSLVCNLQISSSIIIVDSFRLKRQFTTNFYRTSDIMPPLSIYQTILLDCVEYKALNGGCVVGFCDCFVVCYLSMIFWNYKLIVIIEFFVAAELLRGYSDYIYRLFNINVFLPSRLCI